MSLFDQAFQFMLPHEGGLNKRADDPGNWTEGKVGEGELRGTKFGISAASYPEIDIEALTIDEAKEIYLRDWWNKHNWAQILSPAVAIKVFDLCVNFGASGGCKVVQRALIDCGKPVAVDGNFGYLTVHACNQTQEPELLEAIVARAEERHRDIARATPGATPWLNGWLKRDRDLPKGGTE